MSSKYRNHPVALVSLYEWLFSKVWSDFNKLLPLTWGNFYALVVFCAYCKNRSNSCTKCPDVLYSVAIAPCFWIFKASAMKTFVKKLMIDTTILLSFLCPLLFAPIHFGRRRLSTILPTQCPPFHRAIHGKPSIPQLRLPHLLPMEKGWEFARGTGRMPWVAFPDDTGR